ncbi:MAG: SDR family oxidoreductase [Alphaproteobacteria bacterium]|nr:SDR family oxidoreductase [Alphaproteobacteria bacterium]
MAYNLNGKTALVTGGSRGIGAAIAKRLAADGARVALTYGASEQAAKDVVAAIAKAGGEAVAIKANAADPAESAAAVTKTIDAFGALDIYVHNAGVAGFATLADLDFAEFRRQFAVNVDGVFAGTKEAVDKISDGGRIIVVSSINAHAMPVPGGSVYGATKAAVSALVRGWARDLGPRNILVNAIQPGPIDTDMNPADSEFAEMLRPMTALGRYGKVEEVAALAAFLASDQASYITGVGIDIDGGLTV